MIVLKRLMHGSLLLAVTLTGCTGLSIPGPGGPLTSGSDLISNNAGSIVSNNSGSLTGLFRAPVEIVSNNSGSLVSNNTGSYRIGALSETPVAGVTVTAYDLTGKAVTGAEAKTTADGRFVVPVPPNRPLVLRASLASSGKTYVFESIGVAADKATGSADLNAGSTLATESLLRIAAQKGLDLRALVTAKLADLSSLLGGAFDGNRIGVLSEGQAALLDYTNSLMAGNSDLKYLASVLNGYTGLSSVDGALYLADNTRGTLLRRGSNGAFSAWLGGIGSSFADGPAASARFASVYGMVRAADGTIYFADAGNHRIRKVTAAGAVSTLAGGSAGTSDGTGAAAQFRFPTSVALSGGALFVTDTGNNLIRRIDLGSGAVTTVLDAISVTDILGGVSRYPIATPRSLVTDASGTLYFIESSNSRICRLVQGNDGTYGAEVIAGNPTKNAEQWSILDGPGQEAAFFLPMAMAYHDQALYVADTLSHAIRRVDLASGTFDVTTIAGGGPRFPGSADGVGYAARFRGPDSIAVMDDGTIFVGDGGNLTLRQIAGTTVTTVPVTVTE